MGYGETLNALGTNGRDCPTCFRVGSLAGERVDGGTLTCSGCATAFTLARGANDAPDTLTRAAPAHGELVFPKVCGCGRKHWNSGAECGFCTQAAATERFWPSGIPGR